MEARIKSQFSDEVLNEALSRYGIDASDVRSLDGFESFVYECSRAGQDLVLRISHSLHRPAEEIAAEVDWTSYLAANGVNACAAVPSSNGRMLEELGSGSEYFTAAVFSRAPGGPTDVETWQPALFERMGDTMGRMHQLSKRYVPSRPSCKRPHWHEEITGIAEQYLPADHEIVIEKFNANLAATHALPADTDTYGLIHADFHRGNFFVDGGRIHLFDFDDCQYSWFADDIAIALFYALPHDCSAAEDIEFGRTFMRHFLAGYRTQNDVLSDWIARIPMFLKRREMDLYVIIHRSMDVEHLDPWPASFMDGRRSKIENDVPWVDMDFATL